MNGADDNITFDLCSDDRRLLDQLIDVEFDADALEPLQHRLDEELGESYLAFQKLVG